MGYTMFVSDFLQISAGQWPGICLPLVFFWCLMLPWEVINFYASWWTKVALKWLVHQLWNFNGLMLHISKLMNQPFQWEEFLFQRRQRLVLQVSQWHSVSPRRLWGRFLDSDIQWHTWDFGIFNKSMEFSKVFIDFIDVFHGDFPF